LNFTDWGLSVIEVSATEAVERPLTDPQRPLAVVGRDDKSCPKAAVRRAKYQAITFSGESNNRDGR